MAQPGTAGAIILDRLRDRIVSGIYLGVWRPGDRLPSIRDIARAESVDRKTAAAAYRRLADEALVDVRPRSGVYVRDFGIPRVVGTINRIRERWLEQTYASARELGLNTGDILRLISSVKHLENIRVPVLECNWPQAASIAAELHSRLDIHAVPYLFEDVRPGDPLPGEAPILVGTPYHRSELRRIARHGREIVEVTAPANLFRQLCDCVARTHTVVVFPDQVVLEKIRGAYHRTARAHEPPVSAWVIVSDYDDPGDAVRGAATAFLWPGTPEWFEDALASMDIRIVRPHRVVSSRSLERVQSALLAAAVKATAVDEQSRDKVYAA